MINIHDCKGVFVTNTIDNIISLLYAVDKAGFADTVQRLQHQVDCVSDFCERYGIKIN